MLPGPLAWIKKLLRILKSNLSPNQIALSFSLGIFAGLPPMGLHVIIPASIALVLRCSFRAFLISVGLFKLISLAVAPLGYAVGRFLLDPDRGLDPLWRLLFHQPVIAPMGYNRYLLIGEISLSFLIAVPVFLLTRWIVINYRESFSERVARLRVSRWLRDRRGIGLARRFLAGGEARYRTEPRPRGVFRYIRKEMLIGLPAIYGVCYLIAALIVPFFAGTLATSTASWVVGSEVTAKESRFNLFTGRLTLVDLSIQDPKNPEENLIEIPEIDLDAGMTALLAKRVVFNELIIADATLHVKREQDGTLNIDNPSSGWDASGYLKWAAEHADRVDWLGLLRNFAEHLSDLRPLPPRGDPYAPYRGGRSFPAYRPPFAIERVEIGRILVTLEDEFADDPSSPLPPITLLEVEVKNLAFPPELRTDPIEIRLHGRLGDDPDSGFRLTAVLDSTVRSYEFALTRIDLPRLARLYETTIPVRIVSGKATLTGSLLIEDDEANGEMSVLLEELAIAGEPGRPLFGLPEGTSSRVIDGINRYGAEVPIVFATAIGGPADSPKIEWEAQLLEVAREGLAMLGQRRLNGVIEELSARIAELGGVENLPLSPEFAPLKEEAGRAAAQLIEQVGGDIFDLPTSNQETTPSGDLSELLPSLIERLLNPEAQTDSAGR